MSSFVTRILKRKHIYVQEYVTGITIILGFYFLKIFVKFHPFPLSCCCVLLHMSTTRKNGKLFFLIHSTTPYVQACCKPATNFQTFLTSAVNRGERIA
jgi:hypothetical protein